MRAFIIPQYILFHGLRSVKNSNNSINVHNAYWSNVETIAKHWKWNAHMPNNQQFKVSALKSLINIASNASTFCNKTRKMLDRHKFLEREHLPNFSFKQSNAKDKRDIKNWTRDYARDYEFV